MSSYWLKIGSFSRPPSDKTLASIASLLTDYNVSISMEDTMDTRWDKLVKEKYNREVVDEYLPISTDKIIDSDITHIIDEIHHFLVDIPDEPDYDELSFRKTIIMQNIDEKLLIKNPSKVKAVLQPAFQEFSSLYKKQYIDEFFSFQDLCRKFYQNQDKYKDRLIAISRLSKILPISVIDSAELSMEMEYLLQRLRPLTISMEDVSIMLDNDPFISGYGLGQYNILSDKLEKLDKSLDKAVELQIKSLQDHSAASILKQSGDDTIAKILQLISLTQLSDITTLLAGEEGEHIIFELAELLNKKV